MSTAMVHNSYGKSRVRLTKVKRHPDRHELKEVCVDIQLEGEFEASFTDGDNSRVIATDSMKNTVYVLAANHAIPDIETFGKDLTSHFLEQYDQVRSATAQLSEDLWVRIGKNGEEHPHAFVSAGNEKRTATVVTGPDGQRVEAGIENLLVLKTAGSEFSGFIRDRYTTLPEARDRIFATSVSARWSYQGDTADFNRLYEKVRTLILEVFAAHHSLAVQQTIHKMGETVLAACPEIERISFSMPNQHRLPFNLLPFGLENRNEIFVPTDEPYGLIKATLKRAE